MKKTTGHSDVPTALDALRQQTSVDCDTLDTGIASKYGPFVDCTSNQAIAYFELQEERSREVLLKAASLALEWRDQFPGVKLETLVVEIAMLQLSLRMLPHLKPHGFIHVQVNPLDSHSTERIVQGAQRIISIALLLSEKSSQNAARICIKIPSTWAGLRACRILERDFGIRTLATTLFSVTQAIVAEEAACRYIAPYMHGLSDVVNNHLATDPAAEAELKRMMDVVRQAQAYYDDRDKAETTKVLPAALMSVEECLQLSGVHHITLPPRRIEELAALTPDDADTRATSIFGPSPEADDLAFEFDEMERTAKAAIEDQVFFEAEMGKEGDMPGRLMKEAIAVFSDMQTKLEAMAASALPRKAGTNMLMRDW